MADPGTRAADQAQKEMERRMRAIYRQAQKEIIEKLDKHTKTMNATAKVKQAQVAAGEITQKEFDRWMTGQLFMTKQWKEKVDSIATTLLTANRQANAIVENKKRAVFGENALYQAYNLEHGISFSIYDRGAVTRLIKDEPELLPRKVVNGKKDKAWNRKKIANAVTEGVIQGESIPEIAQRIARETSSQNMKAMRRYARTAMTSAQNAGRMEAMHEAQEMGIKVKKKWMATLDNRTRDTHADLDGQVVDVDEPFITSAGNKIMYPGDPSADASEVYNCRCTMVYVYPEYPTENALRRDNITGERIEDMSYSEWKIAKIEQPEGQEENNSIISKIDSMIGRLERRLEQWDDSKYTSFAASANEYTKVEDRIARLYGKRADMKYPDDDVMGGIKHIREKHTVQQDISGANPNYDPKSFEWGNNCQRCVPAYEMRRRGYNVVAKSKMKAGDPMESGGWMKVFENADWISCPKGSGLTEIKKKMEEWGNGSRAEIYVRWKVNKGQRPSAHVFIAEKTSEGIIFRDPQSGTVTMLPWQARVMNGKTFIARIDNLKPSKLILDCCEEAK